MGCPLPHRRLVAGLVLSIATATATVADPGPARPEAPTPAAAAASAPLTPPGAERPVPPAPAAAGQRVEVIGGRESDTDLRRQSTAAKIIIGRDEIEKFGDATVGEVLRRLPGVNTPGAPGRGGAPRLRGLGGGFTQLLIDGQRLPPGFSLDSLTPEQIERIEVLRAPTAETGARAIAGTINIITREGLRRRLNDWRISTGVENGRASLGSFWSHNDSAGTLTYTLSAGLFANRRLDESRTDTDVTALDSGERLEDRSSLNSSQGRNHGLNLNARLQWRLGEGGDSLTLTPGLYTSRNEGDYRFDIDERLRRELTPAFAASGSGGNDNRFFGPRLMFQYRQRVADWRLEGGGHVRASRAQGQSIRDERRADGSVLRTQQDSSDSRERSFSLNAKGSRLLGGESSEHSLVLGAEVESARRGDSRTRIEDGRPALTEFGETFEAATLRLAAFVQDEWSLNPRWSVHAGLRWEGITTRGDDGQGGQPQNHNSVWTPLVHLLWKPDPKLRDQVRLSLTRSWRAPSTANLIGRPNITRLYDPALGPNTEANPDSAGNPQLQPELATGIDLAFERYLQGGGLLSANLFHRRISDLMRGVTQLEQVPWSPYPRWVRRTRNIGQASTQGLELEAKFRLDQLHAGAPPVEMRANAALYRSRVDEVPGPDNRLDDQARATANLGADYRLRGTPLTLGGNLNWVPATTTRLAAEQTRRTPNKRQWDLFALWAFGPEVGLRLMANNLLPLDYVTESLDDTLNPDTGALERTRVRSGGPSQTHWQLRLEIKL